MPELVLAASALIVYGNRLLFVRSKRTVKQWAFPGGKAETGETAEQTAIREVKEEVGLDIEVTDSLGRYVTPSGFDIVCLLGAAKTSDLTIDDREILEARWCSLEEGLQLDLVSTVRQALAAFASIRPGFGDQVP